VEDEEEVEEEQSSQKKATTTKGKPAGKQVGRPSKYDLLVAELEASKVAREEDRLARVELEKKLQELQGQNSQAQSVTTVASTPALAVAMTPASNISASSGHGSHGSASIVQVRYCKLKELAEDISASAENAKLKLDNMLMRKAMNGE
jgi:hypothetical protein